MSLSLETLALAKSYTDNVVERGEDGSIEPSSSFIYKITGTSSAPTDLFDLIKYKEGTVRSCILVANDNGNVSVVKFKNKTYSLGGVFGCGFVNVTIMANKNVFLRQFSTNGNVSTENIRLYTYNAETDEYSDSESKGHFLGSSSSSATMDTDYVPVTSQHLITKKYLEDYVADNLGIVLGGAY